MSEETKKSERAAALVATFRKLIADNAEARELLKVALEPSIERPANWSRRSYAGYYNEDVAREVMIILDKIAELGDEFGNKGLLLPKDTLRVATRSYVIRFTQGFMYIKDHAHELDPTGKYQELRAKIKVSPSYKGISFTLKFNPQSIDPVVEEIHKSTPGLNKIRNEVEDFMAVAVTDEMKSWKNIALSEGDVDNLKLIVEPLNIIVHYDNKILTLLKE